jgi:hypothetical protein
MLNKGSSIINIALLTVIGTILLVIALDLVNVDQLLLAGILSVLIALYSLKLSKELLVQHPPAKQPSDTPPDRPS